MSVTTSADRSKDEALEHVKQAYKCLLDTINPNTWGSEDFSKEYNLKIHKALINLADINNDLK